MYYVDPFEELFYQTFGNIDALFRDLERKKGLRNKLPIITLPGLKSHYEDVRCYDDGEKVTYYKNGMVHNDQGPAVSYHNDKENKKSEYWLVGKKVTKKAFEDYKTKLEDEKIHYVTIDGIEHSLSGKELRELRKHLPEPKEETQSS